MTDDEMVGFGEPRMTHELRTLVHPGTNIVPEMKQVTQVI